MFVHGPYIAAADDDSSAGSEEEDVGDIVQVRFIVPNLSTNHIYETY